MLRRYPHMKIFEPVFRSQLRMIFILGASRCSLGKPAFHTPAAAASVRVYPAPQGGGIVEGLRGASQKANRCRFTSAKVAPADPARRWKAMDMTQRIQAEYFDTASFAYFDICRSARFDHGSLPGRHPVGESAALFVEYSGGHQGKNELTVKLADPTPLTIEINGNWVKAVGTCLPTPPGI